MKKVKCVMNSGIVLNVNELFNPNSFNRVEEEDWVHKPRWEPLSLILDPLRIDVVLPWKFANAISIPDYVKRIIFVDSPHVVQAFQNGLRRAVDRVLTTIPSLHDQDCLYFALSSNRLTNNFQGWGLHAGEWQDGGARLDALFNRLAQALNSNEQFEMDDSFQLSITQVHHAPRGSGTKRQLKPGHQTLKKLNVKKQSVICIQNDDVLCCARALVTAKAKVEQHPKWNSIRQGGKLQKRHALLLHHEAHVPFRPCGYEELTHSVQPPPSTSTRTSWWTRTVPSM